MRAPKIEPMRPTAKAQPTPVARMCRRIKFRRNAVVAVLRADGADAAQAGRHKCHRHR